MELLDLEALPQVGSSVYSTHGCCLVSIDILAKLTTPNLLQYGLNFWNPCSTSNNDKLQRKNKSYKKKKKLIRCLIL